MIPLGVIPTALTDGKNIYYNPKWISSLEFNHVVGLIAHEILHCVLNHLTRIGHRKPGKWNKATDYVVNRLLTDDRLELPNGGLVSQKYTTAWSAERIYDDLHDDSTGEEFIKVLMEALSGNGDASDLPPDSGGLFAPSTHTSEAERSELEQEWRIAATQAARVAKAQGKLPGGLEELFKDLLAPKIDWKEVLRRFVQQSTFHDDYTWRRPNRRLVSQGLYFPSMLGESTGKLVVAVDTSGSISSNELQQFLSEVNAILEETSPERLYVMYADAAVQRVDEYTREDAPIVMRAVGRGGTDFRPVFKEVETRDIQPAALIYLTDMYGSFPQERPSYPTLWISNSSADSAPFGEVVRMHS